MMKCRDRDDRLIGAIVLASAGSVSQWTNRRQRLLDLLIFYMRRRTHQHVGRNFLYL